MHLTYLDFGSFNLCTVNIADSIGLSDVWVVRFGTETTIVAIEPANKNETQRSV